MTVIERTAISFSRMKNFRECPKRAWHDAYSPPGHPDRMPYVESPETARGKRYHKALERRVAHGRPLPDDMARIEPIAADVERVAKGCDEAAFERQWAWTRKLERVDWFAKSAWWRVEADAALVSRPARRGWLFDYKTGKVYPHEEQLEEYALAMFLIYDELDYVDTAFLWLDHDDRTDKRYTRDDAERIFERVSATASEIDKCALLEHWPAKPSKFGCGFCTANKKKVCAEARFPYIGKD